MKKNALIFVLFWLIPGSAFAQEKPAQNTSNKIINVLSVSPIIIDTAISKGTRYSYVLKVKNLLDIPLGIRTSIENFNPSDEESLIDTSSKQSPLISYSNLSDESFITPPHQTKSFTLNINTPLNLKDGGYYEVIFLTPFYVRSIGNDSPTVLSKIGILVLANAGKIDYSNLQTKVKVLDLKVSGNKSLTPLIRVENLYFNHFSAKPFLTLTPLFGNPERFELTEKRILPGKVRRWNDEIKPKTKSFFYKANLAVSIGQGKYVYKDSYFILFPFKKAILAILLISFATFIAWRRKQIKRAVRVVISGK